MTARLKYLNRPGDVIGYDYVNRQIDNFIEQERLITGELAFRYTIRYVAGDQLANNIAFLIVYRVNSEEGPNGKWDTVGTYQATEIKRFRSDIERITETNPTGSLELADNELYNGLFNMIPNKLDGWEITDDSTTGTLTMKGKGDRMEITSDGVGSFTITNTKTTLTNLLSYATTLSVFSIDGGPSTEVKLIIGTTEGTARSTANVFNEIIIGGGSEVIIKGIIGAGDDRIVLDYIIINED